MGSEKNFSLKLYGLILCISIISLSALIKQHKLSLLGISIFTFMKKLPSYFERYLLKCGSLQLLNKIFLDAITSTYCTSNFSSFPSKIIKLLFNSSNQSIQIFFTKSP